MSALTARDSAVESSMPSFGLSPRLPRGFLDRGRTPEVIADLGSTCSRSPRDVIPRLARR